jgi:spermidine synthase
VLKSPSVEEVVLVDLDPMITELASSHPLFVELNDGALATDRTRVHSGGGVSPGEPLEVIRESSLAPMRLDQSVYQTARVQGLNLDAGLYLRQAGSGSFDVVILDFPDPHHLELAKLYSVDFYRSLQRLMHPGTVVSCQSTSPYHARDTFLCIGKTMRAAGLAAVPLQHNVPSFGQWGWHLAAAGGIDAEALLAHRLRSIELHAETRYLTESLVRGTLDFGRGVLDDTAIAINTPLRPSIVTYYRQAWKH